MVPQVLFFVFLLITTVVAVWKDLGNGYLSLALAWNATNTLILGSFVVTAWREGHRGRLAAKAARSTQATEAPTSHTEGTAPDDATNALETTPTGGVA
jgi:cellulose synthase (UDP-forming)